MEGRRRNNHRRSQNRNLPRGMSGILDYIISVIVFAWFDFVASDFRFHLRLFLAWFQCCGLLI